MKWLVSGGVAGVTSKVVMLPLDIIKKRLEVYHQLPSAPVHSCGFHGYSFNGCGVH